VFVGHVICFTIFQRIYPKKRGFQIYYTNLPMFTIKSLPLFTTCHSSLDPLFHNLKDLDSRLGAAGHVSSPTYFSNLLEDKNRRLWIKLTLSLILRVHLRLGGYFIWSASLIAPHIKKIDNYLGYEHLTASMQPRKYSKDTFKVKSGRTRRCLQKYSDACSTRL
jgi:hypothetical protein